VSRDMTALLPVGRTADRPARQQGLRDHNLAVVLRRIADAQPVSRADLAASTGLTRATVSSLVDSLVAGGLVSERAPEPRAGAGRPATGLDLAENGAAALGIEINVDYVAVCLVDLTGDVRHRSVVIEDQRRLSAEQAVAGAGELARAAVAAAALEGLPVIGAMLAVPGLVETRTGLLRSAPNLGWHDLDVAAMLAAEPGLRSLPLGIGNEANLAALGELAATRPSGPTSFVYLSGEIGVGAGIVLDGELFRGTHGWGGEIGHFPIDRAGPLCSCGSRGCLEQTAGQEAILARAGLIVPATTSMAGRPGLGQIYQLAEAGEPMMLKALREAGSALGLAVSGVLNIVDVDTVVLGGLYAAVAPWLVPEVERELNNRVIAHAWHPVTVRVSSLGSDAAMLGAAGSVLRRVLDHPAHYLG